MFNVISILIFYNIGYSQTMKELQNFSSEEYPINTNKLAE